MKIQIEDSCNVSVTVNTASDYVSKEKFQNITNEMYKLMFTVRSNEETKAVPETPKNTVTETPTPIVTPKDDLIIRPRIPNNIVDIKDLTIEKAVTEEALVRCPKCGQAHCLAVPSGNHIYLMRRDFKDNEFGIIAELDSLNSEDFINVCCKPDTDRQAYYNDLQNMSFLYDTDFAVNNDTEIFCPVCCQSDTFFNWKDAYENPLNYFETEQLCDACGGEKIDRFIKKKHIYQCDKCGLQTDFQED